MSERLQVNEVFLSIQGESTRAGEPCVFVRLRGCHLRCRYCDTEYAFKEGAAREIDDLVEEILSMTASLVEVTGGEPLLQQGVHSMMSQLCDAGRTVLLETSGACDISVCDPRVIRILDLKTPASGEADRNLMENIDHLRPHDEVKFVICDREDYLWARDLVGRHGLAGRVAAVLFSPVHEQPAGDEIPGMAGLDPADLAAWILEDALPVRLQIQLHKVIWHPSRRGV